MHYLLTEKEMNKLASVKSQLNLVATLIAEMRPDNTDTMCAPADLYEFLDAQRGCLEELESSANARHQATREDMQMTWADWMHALRIANGRVSHTPNGAEQKIDDALSHMAEIDPDYGQVVKTWVDITNRQAKEQRAKGSIKEVMAETEPSGTLSATLFSNLLHAVSGQEMEPDALNETVREFMAGLDEYHPERSLITDALNAALMHNGYEWVLTCGQDGQHSQWVRKAEATAPETEPDTGTAMTDRVAA